jgi:hypothetical protein
MGHLLPSCDATRVPGATSRPDRCRSRSDVATIADVIRWHDQYPNDWKRTWFEIQRKWSDDVGTPRAVFEPFNIDAKLNSAYVVLGLLYRKGDFGKTVSIATRAGQDSDCNPSSAAGILGTMLGYEKIPAYWKQGLTAVEPIDFKYTTISLDDVAGSRAAAKSDTFRTVMERGVGKLWKVLTPGPRPWPGCQIIRTRKGHSLV